MQSVHRARTRTRTLASCAAAALAAAVAAPLALGAHADASSRVAARAAIPAAKHRAHPSVSSIVWGAAHGQPVRLWTLSSGRGLKVKITNYGGVVQSIWAPDRHGRLADVALGFAHLSDYVNDFENQPWPASGGSGDTYFGAIIGRYANRIANHSFTLNGTTYQLPGNNGTNNATTLHGGPDAWNTKVWSATAAANRRAASLVLSYTDPAGANGFPGQVTTTVTYTVTRTNVLQIGYSATSTAPTVINLTNHTYFNLGGEGSGTVYGELLRINANRFSPVDTNLIPTGFAAVRGTPFDFRSPKPIGRDIRRAGAPQGGQLTIAHGYDHNWVLRGSGLRLAATAVDPGSGRVLRTYTTEPGLQVYTSNFLVGDLVGASGHVYRQGDAFTLETQHYPDSPHHIGQAGWPSVVLNPGQTFRSTTQFAFATLPS